MNLTQLETDILNHRLEVPDSVCDALNAETESDRHTYHSDDVTDICEMLLQGDFKGALAYSESITFDVLKDCVEGSTYYGAAIADQSPQKLAAIEKAGRSLAHKVSEFINSDTVLEFPLY